MISNVQMAIRHERFVQEYCSDLNASAAAVRAGWRHPSAGRALMKRMDVRLAIARHLSDRAHRLQITADDVLVVLWTRIQSLLAADIHDIMLDDGSFRPMGEWPQFWRNGGIVGFKTLKKFERSSDGEVADEDGRKSWDQAGIVTEVRLANINDLLLKFIELAGKHVGVAAFPQGANAKEIAGEVMGEIDKRIAEGRQRAANRALTE